MSFQCFENPWLKSVSLCLHIQNAGKEKIFKEDSYLKYTKLEDNGKVYYLRLNIHENEKDKPPHLHIDYLCEEFFEKAKKRLASVKSVESLLNKAVGFHVKGIINCRFKLKNTDLGEDSLIKKVSLTTNVDGAKLKLKGIAFEIEGATVKELSWTLNDGDVYLELEGNVDDKYDHSLFYKQTTLIINNMQKIVEGA